MTEIGGGLSWKVKATMPFYAQLVNFALNPETGMRFAILNI
jgi:hypothetical protein